MWFLNFLSHGRSSFYGLSFAEETGGSAAGAGSAGVAAGATDSAAGMPPTTPPAGVSFETLKTLQGDAFRSLLPKEYAEKGYMKTVNNIEDFVKKFDGAQSLIGQRAAPLPTDGDDKWSAFHSATAAKEMKFDGVGDDVLGLFKTAQLSPWQAKIAADGVKKMLDGAAEAENTAFETTLKEALGANADETLTKAKQVMAVALPPQYKILLEGMGAKEFAVVAAYTEAITKKFGGTDNIIKTGGFAPASIGDVRAQLAEAYKVTSDQSVSKADRIAAEQKIATINAQMRNTR
jgi:hypothetical protein